MLRWCALALLVALPGVQACSDATAQIDLVFPKDAECSRDSLDACPKLPEADEPLVWHGEVVWSWSVDACTTVVPSLSPVHISFESLERTAHGWLTITTEPREIVIAPQDQWDLTDDYLDPGSSTYRAEERFPLDLMVSLVGEPSPEALDSLANGAGGVLLFLKASAVETPTFPAAFAIEQVILDARPAAAHSSQDAPAPSAGLLVAGLALVALGLAKRRQAV